MALGGDIEAGGAFVRLYWEDHQWQRGLKRISQGVMTIANRVASASRKMAIASIIAAGPLIAGAKIYAEFSKQMAFVATMLDKPAQHMAQFTDGVRKLAVEFGESTTTLSRGLYDILSASFAPDKALKMLAVTTKAAKAGVTDTAAATKAIIAVLNSYSLSAERASDISDLLFQTVRYGVLTFGELAGHIGLVAATAAQAGVSIEEMGALLAVMTTKGVETSHAVVALNNMIKSIITPTAAAALMAKKLGIEFSASALKARGMISFLREVKTLPLGSLAKLFPSIRSLRGVAAALADIGMLERVYAKMFNRLGATEKAMVEIRKSFAFMLEKIKQAGILILSYIGEALAEDLSEAGEKIVEIALGFGEWLKVNKGLIVSTAKLIATLGTLALTLLVVAKAFTAIAVAVQLAAGPKGWLMLAASAAIALNIWVEMGRVLKEVKRELDTISKAGAKIRKEGETDPLEISPSAITTRAMRGRREEIKRLREDITEAEKRIEHALKKLDELTGIQWEVGEHKHEIRGLASDVKWEENYIRMKKGALEKEITHLNILRGRELQRIHKAKVTAWALGKQTEELKEQAKLALRMGAHFLGFWHVPSLSYAGATPDRKESLLSEIRDNTGETTELLRAQGPLNQQ